jgi:ABC-type branched-subunit amino acid transport system substrate-binding protein
MRSKRTAALLVTLALAVTSAACGSRLSEDERAQAISTGNGGAGVTTDGGTAPDATTDGSTATDDGSVATDGGVSTGDTGGTTTGGGTTGGSTGGTTGPAAPGDCKPGSGSSTGVTPTEIKVGNVSQITGLVPGFAQTSVNGVKAYLNMVNNAGGVCGRKLTLVTADDRFQSATNRSETEKMSGSVLALVGNLSVVDDGGAPVLDAKGLPDVSLATTKTRVGAKNNFSPNPIDPNPGAGNGLGGIINYFKSTEGISKPAIFYQDVATGVNQSNSYKVDFEKAGIPVVATYPVAPTATNFNTQANDMKQKGIDFIITVAEINAVANLAKAFQSVNYFPKVPFYGAQTYGKKFLQLAGPAAEGTKVGLIFAIPEEAAGNPAIAQFNTWYGRTAPGADVDFFALASWVAADMFVTALRAVGPDPTQAKMLAELSKMTAFDGGGLVAKINPAQKKPTPCFHIIEVKGGKWVKTFPAKGFQC